MTTAIKDAEKAFADAKIAYTARATQLVNKFNGGQPVSSADLTDLVVKFLDPMTAASNVLRGLVRGAAPNGTCALPPTGVITDKFGDEWSFGAQIGSDWQVLVNGASFTAVADRLVIRDGLMWAHDGQNDWWTKDGTGRWVTSLAGPYEVAPTLTPFNAKEGARIAYSGPGNASGPGGAMLVDWSMAKWTFGSLSTDGHNAIIMRNGIPFSEAGFTAQPYAGIMMVLHSGMVYVQDAAGTWVYPRAPATLQMPRVA